MELKHFDELARKYSDRGEHVDIAVGLRPSGIIHLGNMFTLGLAGVFGRKVGPHLSKVNLTVCDLDLPDASDWNVKESGHVRYFGDLPDRNDPSISLLVGALRRIEEFAEGLEGKLGVEFSLSKLSTVQRDPRFREGLKRILDTPNSMQYIMRKVPQGASLVYPLCGECGTSNPALRIPNTYDPSTGRIKTACTNDNCPVGEYEVDVLNTDVDLAVHFFMDPIRDRLVGHGSDVHVFGGDYREPHDRVPDHETQIFCDYADSHDGPITKIEKIATMSRIATQGKTPDYLLGPKLYARDGSKMSKSKNNGLSMDVLKSHLRRGYIDRIVDFIQHVVDEGYTNIDYRIVEEKLLIPKD